MTASKQHSPAGTQPILVMKGITKQFGAVTALRGVDFTALSGEVHALIGENGAGKSTLMKILSGAQPPDAGEITFRGEPFRVLLPGEARRRGIAMIYQEPALAPRLTVEQNMYLGQEAHFLGFTSSRTHRVRDILDSLGHPDIDPNGRLSGLGIGKRRIVEIARALLTSASLVIMDEPTSCLSEQDTRRLFDTIRRLKAQGTTVLYISHFLEEVQEIADRYTVLRDGTRVAEGVIAGTSLQTLVGHMVGRSLGEMFPRREHEIGEEILRVEGLSRPPLVREVSLRLRRGEILGIAGLVGAGRTEFLRALFGLDTADGGMVGVANGTPLPASHLAPARCLSRGIDFLSENRKEEGLLINLPIRENVTLSALRRFARRGFIDTQHEHAEVGKHCDALRVRYAGVMQRAIELSGGNQQKVAIARILVNGSSVFLLDEPTKGIDVGSKVDIYRLIGDVAAGGKAVVMVSSYLPELFGVCDSLAVMHRGRLSPVRPIDAWSEESVMAWATSGKELRT